MAPQRLLIDSDAFVLLAGARLLDQSLALFQCATADARRLAALPHMLRRPRPFRARLGNVVADLALRECERIPSLDARAPDALVAQLLAVDDIDEGEALLYAVAAADAGQTLLSGDKRAMRALCREPALQDIRNALEGRVASVEGLLRRLVHVHGQESVAPLLLPLRSCSKALEVAFSDGNIGAAGACSVALQQYEEELHRELGARFLVRH